MKILTKIAITALFTTFALSTDVHYNITVGMNGTTTMHDGNTFPIWGFREGGNGMSPYWVPGPTIRAKEGDRVFLHFTNTSMLVHTIHPHGLDVPQEMDGVPQTSFEVPGMGSFTYEFTAPHPGTYAYHCHVHTVRHLQMGMYGAVVIESPDGEDTVWENGPAFNAEKVWTTGEYDSVWHWDGGEADSDYPYHDFNPDYFIINGKSGSDIWADENTIAQFDVTETLLLRLNNMGFYPHRFLFNGLSAYVVSSDGRALPDPQVVSELTFYPGERYDVLITATLPGEYWVEVEYLSIYDDSVQGTATVPITVTGTVNLPGDLNQDQVVNVLDVILTVNIVLGVNGSPSDFELWAADVNQDGTVDILDIVTMVNMILGN